MASKKMEKYLSYFCVEPHLKNLRYSGVYRLDRTASRSIKNLHIFLRIFIYGLFFLFICQQIIYIYQVRSDPHKVIDTMSLLLTNSDALYKQFVLWKEADRIEQFLHNIMKGPIFNHKKPEHQAQLQRSERQGRLFLRAFNVVAILTCLLWALYPVILHLQEKHVEFAIWLPFDTKTNVKFCMGSIYVWVQTSWLAFTNTTMDAYVSALLAQCKTQLSILRVNLENILDDNDVARLKSSADCKYAFERRFKDILLHFGVIINFANKIQHIFGNAVFYQFLISSWIICTTAYKMVNISPVSVEFVSMAMYMSCILTELLLFCYFGNEVTQESENLTKSAYSMDWVKLSQTQRHDLIIFFERIKRPIQPMAGNIIPLSNATFLSVLKSSYSFYAFLNYCSKKHKMKNDKLH